MKKIRTLLLTSMVLATSAWIGANQYVCWKAKRLLPPLLEKQLGVKIQVQTIRPNYLGTFLVKTDLGKLRVHGRPLFQKNLSWMVRFDAKGVKNEDILPQLRSKFPATPIISGPMDISGEISGLVRSSQPSLDWIINLAGDKMMYSLPEKALTIPFAAQVQLTPHNILIESASLHSLVGIKGKVLSPWDIPDLQLTAQAVNASVSRLLDTFLPNQPNGFLNGKISFLAQIEGDPKNPTIKGSGTLDSLLGKMHLPQLNGTFSYASPHLQAQADFSGGHLTLEGALVSTAAPKWDIKLTDVSLKDIASINGWESVAGDINSKLTYISKNNQTIVDGDIEINRFRWGRFKSEHAIQGKLIANDKTISLIAEALTLKVLIEKSVANVSDFGLDFGKNSRIAASGRVDMAKETVDLFVSGRNIPPDLWPPLVERYPSITGSMDLKGPIKGTWNRIQSDCDISFKDLKFLPSGGSWNGEAKLRGSPEEISLSEIEVTGGYHGALSWRPSHHKGGLKLEANLEQADPLLLFDVMKSTQSVGGLITGKVNLELRGSLPIGLASLSWVKGAIGSFGFDQAVIDAHLDSNKVFIDNFSLEQGARAIKGTAEATGNKSNWDFLSVVQFQRWGSPSLTVDGEAQLKGRASWSEAKLTSNLHAPLLWINDFSFEEVDSKIDLNGNSWSFKGASKKNIHFDVNYNKAIDRLDGTVDGVDISMQTFFEKAVSSVGEIPRGLFDFKTHFSGRADQFNTNISVQTKGIEWRKEKLSGQALLELDGSTITIKQGEGQLAKGGKFFVSGTILRGDHLSFRLLGKGNNLDLQSTFHLLEWPATCAGTTDANLEISGPSSARTTSVTFKGQHQGFGPFAAPGKFSGKVVESNRQWDLSGVRAESGNGYAVLLPGSNIYMDLNGAGTMRLLADSRNLRAGVLTIFGGAEVTGNWKERKKNEDNTPRSPIELDVFARSLWVNQLVLEGNITHLTVRTGGVEFSPIKGSGQQLSGRILYANYPTLEMKEFRLVDGGIEKCFLNGLIGPDKWNYDLRLKQVDAGIVRSLFDTTLDISGQMDGTLKGRGNLKKPEITGDLTLQNGRLDVLPIDLARCQILYKDGVIDARRILATKKRGYQLAGNVRFQADNSDEPRLIPEIDLKIEKGDLTFLREVWPEISKARGSFNARFQMGMKSWGKSVSGYFNAQKFSLVAAHVPNLERGEIKIRLDKNRLHVDEVRAKLGKGVLALFGYVDFKDGRPDFYNLSLRTTNENGINLRIPELSISPGPFLGKFGILKRRLAGSSRGEPLVNLILKGQAETPILAGTIELENSMFTYPPAVPVNTGAKNTSIRRWIKDFWEHLKLDISMVAGARTWYQNELVDANIKGNIQFSGPTTDMDINGKVQTEQGSIVYSGSEFRIKDAILELETKLPAIGEGEAKRTYVYLKANAEKQVFYTDGLSNNNQDTIVMTLDRSLIGEIQPRFYSRYNPGLSPQRALQLALGLPLSDSIDTNSLLPDQRFSKQTDQKEDTDKVLRLGLVQLLDSNLASPLARALARNTGLVDVIRISYQENDPLANNSVTVGNEASANSITQNPFLKYAKGTKVKFGRGISSRLFADYSVRVDEYQNQLDLRHEVELSYQLSRNLYLRGISELDNQSQLGRVPDRRALLENQWRFGLPKAKKAVNKTIERKPALPR